MFKRKAVVSPEYFVPEGRLNYFAPKAPDNFTGLAHRDDAYPIPCNWITANASRFYFTNKQILAAAQPNFIDPNPDGYCRLRAVYFLIKESEIVYVGQSSDLGGRIERHRKTGKVFDSLTWFEAPQLFIDDIEAYYIWRCNPILNNKWPTYAEFGKTAKLLVEKHGEGRNDAVYVITIKAPQSLPWK
jgi:hypothetical protein